MWAASGPTEFINSAAQPPLVTTELAGLPEGQRVYTVGKGYMREVPYDWQVRQQRVCHVLAHHVWQSLHSFRVFWV